MSKRWNVIFLVCSPYKFYGAHSGALYGRAEVMSKIDVPKLDPASNEIPERMETGTQNHEGIVGAGAAVDFLASLADGATRRERLVRAISALHATGDTLVTRLWNGLAAIPGVRCYGPPPGRPRTPTIAFAIAGVPCREAAQALAAEAVFVTNGNFYAVDVLERLGQTAGGLLRAGCACYATAIEVDRLLSGVERLAAR